MSQINSTSRFSSTSEGSVERSLADRCAQDPNPIICYASRSGIVETVHRGSVCAIQVRASGESTILHQVGNIDQVFYLRSALKYVQVLPLIESGAADHYGFNEEELAVMCASHNSEPCHLEVVRSILRKIDESETCLACGGHTPVDMPTAFRYIEAGHKFPFKNPLYNNCSGKHAGFIALCKYLKFPVEGYLQPDHPLQVMVREAICDVFVLDNSPHSKLHVGVDGCGAPQYAISARSAALGIARMCLPAVFDHNEVRQKAIARVISAITHFPYMIYGQEGYCSDLMATFGGKVIGKRGASGVYVTGLVNQGIGFSVKVDDGDMRAIYCVSMKCLEWFFASPNSSASCSCKGCLSAKAAAAAAAGSSSSSGDICCTGATSMGTTVPHSEMGEVSGSGCLLQSLRTLSHYMNQPLLNCSGNLTGHLCPVPHLLESAAMNTSTGVLEKSKEKN